MNYLHMKYAVAIAEANSINKAAEKLFVGQSNMSRAVKELEASLGITIFDRSAKGMSLTPDGEVFIRYAKTLLKETDELEEMFRKGTAGKKRFSVSVPRASYVADAFAKFSSLLRPEEEAELFYRETNSMRTLKNVLQEDYKLGIIRYAENFERYYMGMMEEKNLSCELVTEFRYVLLMGRDSPLAAKESITAGDLKNLIQIAHADPYVPSLSTEEVKKEEIPDESGRRIFVFERASQFELLSQNPETYMWVSPTPKDLLERYGLVQKNCGENKRLYKDVLIHRRESALSELDRLFIGQLMKTKQELFG